MSFTTNREMIAKMARALLVEYRLESEEYREVGPYYLVFKRGAAEMPACLELSGKTQLHNKSGVFELYGERGRNPDFQAQVRMLYGHSVSDVVIELDGLVVTFESGERLVVSGEVYDPDGAGWSLHGHRLVSVGQDLYGGWPVGRVPTWLASMFPT